MEIVYNPGKFNVEADCFSRNLVLDSDHEEEEVLKMVNIITFKI